ncbi:MAG: EpsI family protein [Akkermansiaceae bacterium]|nr:EpsI family protein [Akkermansiaceae bacterium]
MNLRSFILPVALAAGLGSVYVLPQTGSVAQSAIRMTLPNTLGDWQLTHIPPSQAEIDILSADTEFSKAICLTPRRGEYTPEGSPVPDRVDLSIVLSGYDLNNSIHRPERCMPAQGHTILAASSIPLKLANGRTITVRRLRSTQTLVNQQDRKRDRNLESITYYFFVGHHRVECDHLKRTLNDMQVRLIRGMDQRWAYVSVSMWFGQVPWIEQPISEQEADAKLTGFLTQLADRQIDWEQIR